MTRRFIVAVCAWACAALAGARLVVAAPTPRASVLDRAVAYVQGYTSSLKYLIADERSEQWVTRAARPLDASERRVTAGELFVTYLPREDQWTVVHDIAEVDGHPAAVREDLTSLAREAEVSSIARRVFAVNARYNIGPVVRNFNDPLLALLPLGATRRGRFSFSVSSDVTWSDGVARVTLSFRERQRPTLVRDMAGSPVFSTGALDVDPETGRVQRSELRLEHDGITAELATVFSYDDRLSMWVPTSFVERYASNREGTETVTTCVSTYSNYRRFEATGRLR